MCLVLQSEKARIFYLTLIYVTVRLACWLEFYDAYVDESQNDQENANADACQMNRVGHVDSSGAKRVAALGTGLSFG